MEWQELDQVVKLWLFASISQDLSTSAYSIKASTRKIWMNSHTLFYDDVESTNMQLENDMRNITVGNLTFHEYLDKIKKIIDLLEGFG